MIKTLNNIFKQDKEKFVVPKGVQDCIPVTAIYDDGIFRVGKDKYSKEYIVQTEELSSLRGKIDISASVKEQTMLRKRLVCNYDEFSVNSYMNRIIRTTMNTLVRSNISKDRKKQLRKLLIYFAEVEPLNRESINWNSSYYTKL